MPEAIQKMHDVTRLKLIWSSYVLWDQELKKTNDEIYLQEPTVLLSIDKIRLNNKPRLLSSLLKQTIVDFIQVLQVDSNNWIM